MLFKFAEKVVKTMDLNELQMRVYNAGIVGAGGAGFPTHKKLSKSIDTIIVNAVECEPLLRVDHSLLVNNFLKVVQTLEMLLKVTGGSFGYIAVKSKNIKYIKDYKDTSIKSGKIQIKEIADVYPAGDEILLTYEVTGRIVPEGSIPLSLGVVVLNVETVLNIYNAMEGESVTHKTLTLTGDIKEPLNLNVPIGTPVKKLLKSAGIGNINGYDIIMGGPLMGHICDVSREVVAKTTNGIIILPSEHPLIQKKKVKTTTTYKRASAACCQCRMCTDMCPRYLLGYSIEVHKVVRTVVNGITTDTAPYMQSFLCSGCGICDYMACTQDLLPRALCIEVKAQMASNGLRYAGGNTPRTVRGERNYRLVPSQRIIERCGLKKYNIEMGLHIDIIDTDEVRIPLKQHIGSCAIPAVTVGQQVHAGQLIAKVPYEELGANIHASIDGKVYDINKNEIVIIK